MIPEMKHGTKLVDFSVARLLNREAVVVLENALWNFRNEDPEGYKEDFGSLTPDRVVTQKAEFFVNSVGQFAVQFTTNEVANMWNQKEGCWDDWL